MASAQRFRASGAWLASAVATAASSLGCAPGTLPCDKPEWASICADGGGGGSDGGGGAVDMRPAFVPTKDTPVKDCALFTTVGAADPFFKMRCAPENSGCHVTGFADAWQDFERAGIWDRLSRDPMNMNQPRKARAACIGARVVDPTNWENSVLWAKTKTPVVCPSGGGAVGGFTMPPGDMMPKMDALSADELKCIEGFLKGLAGL
jgi:hypothetical protein